MKNEIPDSDKTFLVEFADGKPGVSELAPGEKIPTDPAHPIVNLVVEVRADGMRTLVEERRSRF